ncbi:MAG: DUF58 domain-containing protein [Lachnospiraceae bacterium]|nr:DUF58 domain-containing protein [Ruminococcus sp.]MCM1274897.1 DUF58 domain-containing protein [Lachnospiraceae bacterium]
MTHISGYVQALMFSALFLVFINADIGWALIYIIGAAVVVSLTTFLISRKRFTVSLDGFSGVSEYGRSIDFNVTLRKKGFCFIPYVELCASANSSIHLRTSLLFRKTVTVGGSFRASHSGLNTVTLNEVVIRDFLGLLQLKVPVEQTARVAVLPRIVEYDGPDVPPNLLPSEEEEVEEGAAVTQGGMPGYEHREYVAGDSPRRVNYKLSAKRQTLMVRLDESGGCASTNLYITENALPVCCDKAFALAKRLVIRGGTVKVTHKGEERVAATPETLDRMREWLAFREFAETEEPSAEVPPADAVVVFSGSGQITV